MPMLINVCGASHSGTTILDLMLGNGSNVFSLGEAYAWFRPYRTHHFQIVCSCGQTPCPYWEILRHFPEKKFHVGLLNELQMEYVVDSSKDLVWIIDNNYWMRKNNVKVLNLLIWKEPIALAHSYWKREWGIEAGLFAFIKYHSRFLQTGLPFVSVSYSQLVQQPKQTLGLLCEKIGMEYFEGKERFWETEHHHLFGSGGVRKQIESQEGQIAPPDHTEPKFQEGLAQSAFSAEQDTKLKSLVSILQTHDISSFSVTKADLKPKLTCPRWYYYERVRGYLKRFLPDPWPLPGQ